MCGLTGFWAQRGWERGAEHALRRMTETLRHRGPDDEGYWTDPEAGICLGHRRLAILDLSREGRQPMCSASGRYVIAFNGEIYNFGDLRTELEHTGVAFRGRSDTEALVAAVEHWGLEGAVERLVGMFAFALWDGLERRLHLVRDRVGEKPLYYGWIGPTLLFGSELKALRAHPTWRGEIDRGALALYLHHHYIPAPYSIYQGVQKVSPGTIVTVGAPATAGTVSERRYWSPREVVRHGLANPLPGGEADLVGACDTLLRRVIRGQMIADVPLGAFLSGGVDSSTVVALMQRESRHRVRTFTIGFPELAYDEATAAKAVATHLGTEHTELYVTPSEMVAVIPRLPCLYDEPFGDSSQIPTFLVSQLTRGHVTVSLSGDGGDELFGGYDRYRRWRPVWGAAHRLPYLMRRGLARGVAAVADQGWLHERGHKLAAVLRARTPEAMYGELLSQCADPARTVLGATEPRTVFSSDGDWPESDDFVGRMMYLDLVSYLPDDILVKVDRASMGVALESRAPFLDHRMVEFAWHLPPSTRLRDGRGKWLLRQVLDRYVPRHLVERPKHGFGVPLTAWLAGPLREWAEALLAPARLQREGFFDPVAIRQKWSRHQRGSGRWQDFLWTVLMFQSWLDATGSEPAGASATGVG